MQLDPLRALVHRLGLYFLVAVALFGVPPQLDDFAVYNEFLQTTKYYSNGVPYWRVQIVGSREELIQAVQQTNEPKCIEGTIVTTMRTLTTTDLDHLSNVQTKQAKPPRSHQ